MVSLEPDFSQFFIGTFCMTGAIVLISLLLGMLVSRLLWTFAMRGRFGDE